MPDFDSTFNVGKHIRFVPQNQSRLIPYAFWEDCSMPEWPEDVWTMLLQSVLICGDRVMADPRYLHLLFLKDSVLMQQWMFLPLMNGRQHKGHLPTSPTDKINFLGPILYI